jgi:hypothetical protein
LPSLLSGSENITYPQSNGRHLGNNWEAPLISLAIWKRFHITFKGLGKHNTFLPARRSETFIPFRIPVPFSCTPCIFSVLILFWTNTWSTLSSFKYFILKFLI